MLAGRRESEENRLVTFWIWWPLFYHGKENELMNISSAIKTLWVEGGVLFSFRLNPWTRRKIFDLRLLADRQRDEWQEKVREKGKQNFLFGEKLYCFGCDKPLPGGRENLEICYNISRINVTSKWYLFPDLSRSLWLHFYFPDYTLSSPFERNDPFTHAFRLAHIMLAMIVVKDASERYILCGGKMFVVHQSERYNQTYTHRPHTFKAKNQER